MTSRDPFIGGDYSHGGPQFIEEELDWACFFDALSDFLWLTQREAREEIEFENWWLRYGAKQ